MGTLLHMKNPYLLQLLGEDFDTKKMVGGGPITDSLMSDINNRRSGKNLDGLSRIAGIIKILSSLESRYPNSFKKHSDEIKQLLESNNDNDILPTLETYKISFAQDEKSFSTADTQSGTTIVNNDLKIDDYNSSSSSESGSSINDWLDNAISSIKVRRNVRTFDNNERAFTTVINAEDSLEASQPFTLTTMFTKLLFGKQDRMQFGTGKISLQDGDEDDIVEYVDDSHLQILQTLLPEVCEDMRSITKDKMLLFIMRLVNHSIQASEDAGQVLLEEEQKQLFIETLKKVLQIQDYRDAFGIEPATVKELGSQLLQLLADIQENKAKIEELTTQLQNANTEKTHYESENKQLITDKNIQALALGEKSDENKLLSQSLESNAKDLAATSQELTASKTKQEGIIKELQEKLEKLGGLDAEFKSTLVRLNEFAEENTRLNNELTELKRLTAEKDEKLGEAELNGNMVAMLEAKLQAVLTSMTEEEKEREQLKGTLEEEKNKTAEQIKVVKANLEEYMSTLKSIEDENTELTARIDELILENEKLTGENTKLTKKTQQLQGQNAELTGQNAELTGQNTVLTGQNERLTGQNAELTKDNSRLNKEKVLLIYFLSQLEQKLEGALKEKQDLFTDRNAFEKALGISQEKIAELEEKVKDQLSEVEQIMAELKIAKEEKKKCDKEKEKVKAQYGKSNLEILALLGLANVYTCSFYPLFKNEILPSIQNQFSLTQRAQQLQVVLQGSANKCANESNGAQGFSSSREWSKSTSEVISGDIIPGIVTYKEVDEVFEVSGKDKGTLKEKKDIEIKTEIETELAGESKDRTSEQVGDMKSKSAAAVAAVAGPVVEKETVIAPLVNAVEPTTLPQIDGSKPTIAKKRKKRKQS